MTKDYHLTREAVRKLAIEAGFTMGRHDSPAFLDMLNALVNAALDKVLGEPVGEVEVRKQRILVDTFQQVTSPIADGRHKLYAQKEPT